MLLKLDNSKLLAEAIALISELVLEVNARITKQGFEITAIDPANVALVDLKIPAKAFSKFEIENEEEIGLNLEDFKQVLKRASGLPIVLEKEDNVLKIKIEDKTKRTFSLALITLEAEEKKVPSLSFNSKIEMNAADFAEIINDAAIVADSCAFVVSKDSFVIEAKGTLHSSKTEFSSDEVKITTEQSSRAKYSLDYLVKFAKAARLAEKLLISFSTEYPAKFEFKTEGLDLSFILAPRSEEE
ncbi:MAG: proliferating cell nuclear antigen (pcna) [Candidatus Pacearchaeota archaeon]|nr:proliferating cell nuclear antigen (pcna) [Candidatus Pacearchaeota archaeon]